MAATNSRNQTIKTVMTKTLKSVIQPNFDTPNATKNAIHSVMKEKQKAKT